MHRLICLSYLGCVPERCKIFRTGEAGRDHSFCCVTAMKEKLVLSPLSTIYHVLLFFPDLGAIKGERMMQRVTVLVALRCGAMRLAASCSHTRALYVHEAGV